MWIVKGVLLGIALIVGGISYVGIRIGIALQQVKAAAILSGGAWDIRGLLGSLHSPLILVVLLAAIAIGLWIVRARMTHTV